MLPLFSKVYYKFHKQKKKKKKKKKKKGKTISSAEKTLYF